MADMLIREIRATITGPILIARLGTCGGIGYRAEVGNVVVASEGAVIVQRNWDFFERWYGETEVDVDEEKLEMDAWDNFQNGAGDGQGPYRVSKVCPADKELSSWVNIPVIYLFHLILEVLRNPQLQSCLANHLPPSTIRTGLNVTGDSFYSSQGRYDPTFHDLNKTIVRQITTLLPTAEIMEMETFVLLHCAQTARRYPKSAINGETSGGGIRASACAMVIMDRNGSKVVSPEELVSLERDAGRGVLEAITRCPNN